jgi:hypothetical protein
MKFLDNFLLVWYGMTPLSNLRNCASMKFTKFWHLQKYELENNAYLFQYGPTVGIYDARVAIAKFLSDGYRAPVNRYMKPSGIFDLY